MNLAEVLLALGLFAVLALIFMGLTLSGVAQTEKGELHAAAASAAEAELERLKGRPYSELLDLVGVAPAPVDLERDGHTFELLSVVEPYPPGPSDPDGRSLLLRVEARWREQTGLGGSGGRFERDASYELTGLAAPGLAL